MSNDANRNQPETTIMNATRQPLRFSSLGKALAHVCVPENHVASVTRREGESLDDAIKRLDAKAAAVLGRPVQGDTLVAT